MEGRQRRSFTDDSSGKRLIWSHRVAARSDRWPRNLVCAIPCCGGGWRRHSAIGYLSPIEMELKAV